MEKKMIRQKQRARRLTLQALYQWLMANQDLNQIEAEYRLEHADKKIDMDYFVKLLYEIPAHLSTLETAFSPFLDRGLDELNPVERTILRMGSYELLFCLETPYKVVLEEAVLLAKEYGAQDGHRYVNGVLHQLAQKARSIEMKRPDER